ncbi:MAG: tetratricopeptide repeat protein [Planctomycetota bacterium]|jgi:serine/threonine protein kinase/tetratricopeptide (TPR) repeat protein
MDREEQLAEIVAAWRAEREQGGIADPERFVLSHPDLADDLRARFAAIDMLEQRFAGAVPKRIGEYRIVKEIGRGGMGVVYEAEQASMRRRVALKVLYPSITGSPRAVKRFQQEAWAAGRLKHTNIVAVYHLAQEGGIWYSAMELVDGRPLSDVVADLRDSRGRPRESRLARRARQAARSSTFTGTETGTRAYYARVAEMFADVAEALQVVHDHGVIHRDIKPGNLLLDTEGNLKLVDFGLARLEDSGAMTMTGEIVGTPFYMSPEQLGGDRDALDARTDIYSLGATLYEAIALRPPFRGDSLQVVAARILQNDPARLTRWDRQVPRDLDTIVLKALDKDPRRRYGTASELAHDLRNFAQGLSIRARRTSLPARAWRRVKRHKVRSGLAAAVLVLAAGGVWLAMKAHDSDTRRIVLEYERLCRLADNASAVDFVGGPQGGRAIGLYTEAIELMPERWEAYLGRGEVFLDRSFEQRSADLDAARERGLPDRVYELSLANLQLTFGRPVAAQAARKRAESLPPSGVMDHLLLGRMLLAEGESEAAAAEFRKAIAGTKPGQLMRYRAHLWSAHAHIDLRDWDGALEDALVLRAAGDKSTEVSILLASMWRRVGRTEKARALLDETLAWVRRTRDARAWHALAVSCGSFDELGWMDEATSGAAQEFPEEIPLLVVRGEYFNLARRDGETLAMAGRILARDPENVAALNMRGNALIREVDARASLGDRLGPDETEKAERALADFSRASDAAPLHNGFLVNRANALRLLRRTDEAAACFRRALDRDPYDASALLNLAILEYERGRYEEAIRLCDRRLKLDRLDNKPNNTKALALQRLKRPKEALAALELWTEGTGLPTYHTTRATILRDLGRRDEELRALERAIELDTSNFTAHINLGRRYSEVGRPRLALPLLQKAARLQPHRGDIHVYIGNCHLAERDTARARESYAEAARLAADNHEAWSSLGMALALLGDVDEALAAHRKAIAIQRNSMTVNNYADALLRKGRIDEALHEYRTAVELDPANYAPHFNIGTILFRQRQFEEALDEFREAERLNPKDLDSVFEQGRALHELKRHDEALAIAKRIIDAEPRRGRGYVLRGDAASQLRQWNVARDSYARFLDMKSTEGNVWGIWLGRGHACHNLGEFEEAERCYIASFEVQRTPYALGALAGLHLDRSDRRPEEALRLIDQVLQHMQHPVFHQIRGRSLYRLDRHDEAVAALETAMKTGGNDGWSWIALAMVNTKLGKKDVARLWYEKSVAWIEKEAPDDRQIARLRDEAKSLLER